MHGYLIVIVHLTAALLAGGVIGLERTYNGRPAGFRTHTLVCMASSLLMLVTVYQLELLPTMPLQIIRIDPTRMAQGIMTGIGFLGAGVIVKERMSVRGLTTAASIWMTAAIGILIGIGFYFAAAMAFVLTLGALSVFRLIESKVPSLYYGRLIVRMRGKRKIEEGELLALIRDQGCSASRPSYHLQDSGESFEYTLTVRTRDRANFGRLADTLAADERAVEFNLVRISD
jgi:putative Mg2+ transporter-C (MgtC) family protein